jgi:hypothetical protein
MGYEKEKNNHNNVRFRRMLQRVNKEIVKLLKKDEREDDNKNNVEKNYE